MAVSRACSLHCWALGVPLSLSKSFFIVIKITVYTVQCYSLTVCNNNINKAVPKKSLAYTTSYIHIYTCSICRHRIHYYYLGLKKRTYRARRFTHTRQCVVLNTHTTGKGKGNKEKKEKPHPSTMRTPAPPQQKASNYASRRIRD